MESERITRCDENGKPLGTASRAEIHKYGDWHQTFHCWFVSRKDGKDWIHLQLRSGAKKDFPNLLDITAAGHLLADEKAEDGVREVEEELGIPVKFEDLVPLDVIKDQIHLGDFIDNELCQVFLYRMPNHDVKYKFQKEEVADMLVMEFENFFSLCTGRKEEAEAVAYGDYADRFQKDASRKVNLYDLVPHGKGYLEKVAALIQEQLDA
ncbi:NUDIX hydrolase [Planococcus sp. FY231025]|uniref:NUDIX hydrolase n=1 Tax=Planococcus sp. FY231025 TaxID=3455699 RepID=UPI003F933056